MLGQFLSEVYEPRSFSITEPRMRDKAHLVSQFCIRRHFSAALFPGPLFRGLDETPSEPFSTVFGIDIPAFKIPDIIALAILHKGPNTRFEKTRQLAIRSIGDEHKLGIHMVKNIQHLSFMVVIARCVPK